MISGDSQFCVAEAAEIAISLALVKNMTQQDLQILFAYDRWANNRTIRAASTLSADDFVRDLGGGFRSVRDTLVHIIGGEWLWLAYWKEPPLTPDALAELIARRGVLFNPDELPEAAAVQLKWAEVEKEQIEFVNRVTDELLEEMLPFRTTHVKLAHLMQHLANHSTYHRGQIAYMMRQLHAAPLATDFHVFLVEGQHEGTAPISTPMIQPPS